MSSDSFAGKSIGAMHEQMRAGKLSAQDLAEICIARIAAVEADCLAWENFAADILRQQARACDQRLASGQPLRLLEGMPVAVKDIINTTEYPTQMGSPLWQGFTPGNDARLVYNFKRQGGLTAGKSVTAEFAVHALGKTKNPHDATRNPGTSSSGSAAAIAAGMVPFALGTQTAGSIVRPSSYCGVWGCKPSFGLLPRTGMLKTTDTLDTAGFFVGSASDLQRGWQSLRVAGRDYPIAERAMSDPARNSRPAGRPWKIALLQTHTWQYACEESKQALHNWAQQVSRDSRFVVEICEAPAILQQAHATHATIYERTLHYYFQQEHQQAEFVSPVMNEMLARGGQIATPAFVAAMALQEQMAAEMDAFLSGYDALLSLSTSACAPLRDEDEKPDPALIWTMTHLPVVAAPAFVNQAGLPFGLQLAARRYNDLQLFCLVEDLCAAGFLPEAQHPRALAGK
ncbi:amidase [Massilia sp. W12]|uniref:amidase n=1 Tax=Massilia sp. W12 TaxID=3126507 RepID=UPI0030CF455E